MSGDWLSRADLGLGPTRELCFKHGDMKRRKLEAGMIYSWLVKQSCHQLEALPPSDKHLRQLSLL